MRPERLNAMLRHLIQRHSREGNDGIRREDHKEEDHVIWRADTREESTLKLHSAVHGSDSLVTGVAIYWESDQMRSASAAAGSSLAQREGGSGAAVSVSKGCMHLWSAAHLFAHPLVTRP